MRRDRKWVPRARGNTYCSPACGGGCTKKAYDAAVKECARLVKRLGAGWKPHVYENLGWHYRALSTDGRIVVYYDVYSDKSTGYSMFMRAMKCTVRHSSLKGLFAAARAVLLSEIAHAAQALKALEAK